MRVYDFKKRVCLVASDFDKCATIHNTGFKPPFDRTDPFLEKEVARKNIKYGYRPVHNDKSQSYFSIVTMHRDINVVGLHLEVMFDGYDVIQNNEIETFATENGGEFLLTSFSLKKAANSNLDDPSSLPIYVAYLPSFGEDGNDLESYHINQKKVGDKMLMIQTIENKLRFNHGVFPDEVNFFDDKKKNLEPVFKSMPAYWSCYLVDHAKDVVEDFSAYKLYANDSRPGVIQVDSRKCLLDTWPQESYKVRSSQRLFEFAGHACDEIKANSSSAKYFNVN